MDTNDRKRQAHNLIDLIFRNLFPAQGMPERPAQIALSHQILDVMINRETILCDAATGIGKTYAYLASGTAYNLYRADLGFPSLPLAVSTATVPLQRAVVEDYLPFLSKILLETGQINRPIQAVIRKGKEHYVCDDRLEKRLRKVNLQKKNPAAASALLSLKNYLDMDEVLHLTNYDRRQTCVSHCDCKRSSCRYRRFLERCMDGRYQFQICNHNLLLADAVHRSLGRRPILPEYPALIVDEAHRLPDAARQMLGVTLRRSDFQTAAELLRTERFLFAAERLECASIRFQHRLVRPWDKKQTVESFLSLLSAPNRELRVIQQQLERELTPAARHKLDSLSASVSLFCGGSPDMIFYTQPDETGGTMLCAVVSDLTAQLQRILWRRPCGIVLTSATLAVGNSFRRYKETAGLPAGGSIQECVYPSPFDYKNKCLLYLPMVPPWQASRDYFREIADEIAALVRAAHGHALVLLTSYDAMSAVKEQLEGKVHTPLLTMSRNAVHTVEQFKANPGSVLLAAGAAWEGFDLPHVSLLVIPRLPFAYPDALKEREKEGYPTLQDFIQAVAVPEMQIKLKQGFGRAVRTENDSCVIAILDERAVPERHRYFADVMEALPEMQITRSLLDVERFIRRVKPDDYFLEGSA